MRQQAGRGGGDRRQPRRRPRHRDRARLARLHGVRDRPHADNRASRRGAARSATPPPRSRRPAERAWRSRVDHRNDDEVEALFARVREEEGRLDILVNNAALIHDELQSPLPFWEKPLAASVDLLEVGLRSGLVASYYAAPLLVETGRGLVVFTSAPGAVHYQYGAAYGAHKAGHGQVRRRHGRRLPAVRRRRGVDLDGRGADRTGPADHRQRTRARLPRRHRGDAGVHRARHRRPGGRPGRPRRQRTHPHRRGSGATVRDQRPGWPAAAVGARADVGAAGQLPGTDRIRR